MDNHCDPLWCEDCEYFKSFGMDGEGECSKGEEDVWYGKPVCAAFKKKGDD